MHTPLLDKHRRRLFLYLVAIAVFQSLTLIWLMHQAKLALQTQQFEISITWIIVAIIGILIIALGRYLERYLAEIFAQAFINELRQNVFSKALDLPSKDAFLINKGGTLLRLTGDMSAIRNWIVNGLVPAIVFSIWLFVAFLSLYLIHPIFIVSVLPVVLLIGTGNYLLGKKLYISSKNVRRTKSQLIRYVTEKLREFRLITLFNQTTREKRRFASRSIKLIEGNAKKANWSGLIRGFNECMFGLSLLSLLSAGIYLTQNKLITPADVVLVMSGGLYFLSHLRPLSRLYELWTLKTVADHKLEAFFSRQSRASSGTKRRPKNTLTFALENIHLKPSYQPINAQLKPKDRVLLEGSSGSGKSNLLLFLAGVVEAKTGELLINGIKSSRYQPWVHSQLVALVSPEIPLLRGSIQSNLFYGARKSDPDYTAKVFTLCELDEWIKTKPAGLQYRLEEGGANLSSTERYQVMLARALLRKPSLLLLDNDAALQDTNIQKIISNLLEWYEGAIILSQAPEFTEHHFHQIWQLRKSAPMLTTDVFNQETAATSYD